MSSKSAIYYSKHLFPLADRPTMADLKPFGIDSVFSREARNLRAKGIGEFRPPKKGEWFLSGNPIDAYRHNTAATLSISYYIAKLVMTETVTIVREVETIKKKSKQQKEQR